LLGVRMVTKLKRTFIKSENVRKGKRNKLWLRLNTKRDGRIKFKLYSCYYTYKQIKGEISTYLLLTKAFSLDIGH
jgi:hypothetical protein